MQNDPKNDETPDGGTSGVSRKKETDCNTIVAQLSDDINNAPGRGDEDQALNFVPPLSDEGGKELENDIFIPPDDWEYKKPVITEDQTFGLHWLSLTLFCQRDDAFRLYMELFYDKFGELYELGHGLIGFRSVLAGQFGFKIAYDPISVTKMTYVSFIIPGAACERLDKTIVARLYNECQLRGIRIQCTRIDYKFDQCNFSPYQFRWMIQNSLVNMVAHRRKIRHIQSDDMNEIGKLGKITVYVGSQKSRRQICCYDTHGFTRLEIRNKDDWAKEIFISLASVDVEKWEKFLLGSLQDYIYFDHDLWRQFISNAPRAYMKMETKEDPTLDELEKNFSIQWIAAFSTLYDIKGEKWLTKKLEDGREKRKNLPKYGVLLHRYGIDDL